MGAPKIGSSLSKPVDPVVASGAVDEMSPEMRALEQPDVYDYLERESLEPTGVMPTPPPLILAYCTQHELMWRWFSKPMVDRLGMREWTAFSPNGAMRDEIRLSGSANPHGLKVSVDNLVIWRDDAFLGVIKRKRYEARRTLKRKLTDEQTKSAQHPQELLEVASRVRGAKINEFSVSTEEHRFKSGDDSAG